MATLIKTYYGETTGSSSSTSYRFRVVTQLQYTQTDANSGYYIQMRRYLEVTASPTSSVWAYATVNWQSARVGLAAAGTYADTGWVDVGWIAYGASYSWICTGGYTGGSGSYYGSDASGSYTVPVPYYTLDVNAKINGTDTQPVDHCTFDMYLNGTLAADDVGDFVQSVAHGTTFEVKDIKAKSGYVYNGFEPALSGTITGAYTVWLKFLSLYAVKYDANGGSGAPAEQTKTYGTALTLRTGKPTRSGYNFSHWNTKSNGSGTTYQSGGTYSANAAVTLYAIWSPWAHTVAFNANGGSGAPSSQTKKYGSTIKLSTTVPTKTGHTFLEWNTKSDGSGTGYSPGQEYGYDQDGGTVTLYAQWRADTYTVRYDANGGSGAPAAQSKTYGIALVLSSTKPTRPGYKFLYWATSKTATSGYAPGEKFYNEGNVTLYAIWEVDNAIYVKVAGRFAFGAAYVKVDGKWAMGQNVYAKDDDKWHMSTR